MDAQTTHCLHLDAEVRAVALKRMRSVKGHLDGIVRMLESESTFSTAAARGDADKMVAELMDVLKYR